MKTLSLTQSNVAQSISQKGSTYGEASITPSPDSIQFSRRGYKPLYEDRTDALLTEITIFSLYRYSIME